MPDANIFKWKLCLIGEGAVGKTSLIRRYVYDEFDDKYIATLGTKVSKKEMKIQNPENSGLLDVQLIIWDIMGQQGFRQLLQEAYFFGAQGIIGVCDITRKETLSELYSWMDAVLSIVGVIPTVILGNKYDLADNQQIDINELKSFGSRYEKTEVYFSSAKTGLNIELAFKTLSEKIIEDVF